MMRPDKEPKGFINGVFGITGQGAGPASRGSAVTSRGIPTQCLMVPSRRRLSRRYLPSDIPLDEEESIEDPNAKFNPSDDCEIIPNPVKTNPTDFGSLLTEYGRAVIKSAMDHSPTEAESLKNNIITAKEKVDVKHKTVKNKLKIAEGEVRKLRSSVFELREVQAASDQVKEVDSTTIQDLKKQHKHEWEEKKRFAALLEQETVKRKALEVELAELKRDKKRKRESVAAIWEEAEKIKLN